MLAPSEFIELAEETGLIVPLGEQVTRRALTQLHKWDTAERPLRVPLLAVNFSAVQLSRWTFGTVIREVLADTRVDPGRLCAEITETVLMANTETTRASVAELKRLGVRIGIDDFGTGYSSLAYLEELPGGDLEDRPAIRGRHLRRGHRVGHHRPGRCRHCAHARDKRHGRRRGGTGTARVLEAMRLRLGSGLSVGATHAA